MSRNLETLRERYQAAQFARTFKGKIFNIFGKLFAAYCISRIIGVRFPLLRRMHLDNLIFIVNLQRHFLSALFLIHNLPGPIHEPALFPLLLFFLVVTSRGKRQVRGPRRCRTAAQFGTCRIDHLEQHQIGAEGCCEGMFFRFFEKERCFSKRHVSKSMCMIG